MDNAFVFINCEPGKEPSIIQKLYEIIIETTKEKEVMNGMNIDISDIQVFESDNKEQSSSKHVTFEEKDLT